METHQIHGLLDHAEAHVALAVDVSAGFIQHAGISALGADLAHEGIVAIHFGEPLPHGGKVILIGGIFKADGVFGEEVAERSGQAVGAPGELIGEPLLAEAAEQFDAGAFQGLCHAVEQHQVGGVLLDSHDLVAGEFNELFHLGGFDPGTGESGVVVDHHTDIQLIGQQLVVLQHAVNGGDEVVGQDHLHAVGTNGLGILADLDGALRAGAAGAGDKLYEVQDYMTLTKHSYTIQMIGISEAYFQTLPEDVQQILIEEGHNLELRNREELEAIDSAQLEELKKVMDVYELTDEEYQEFRDIASTTWDAAKEEMGDEYAKYVLVDMSDDADAKIDDASSDDYLFVLHDSNKRINIGNDKAYFEYDVIVDGEVTTAMINDGDENELEEGKLYNKIKTNSDEYITGGDEIGYDTDEASGTDLKSSTDPIKHSNGTLQLGGKKWIVASDAEIYLAVDGVDANKDLLKDADADFETYLKISANSLAGYLNGYDYTYDYYAVRDDDNSEILTDLYVWVTSAKETNNSGSSTEDTDKGNGYTAETSMASNGRATVRLTANRPSYAAGKVNFSFDVFVGGEYVDTKNGTIESGKDTVTVNWTDSGFDTKDKITIKNFKFDPAEVKVVFEGANIPEATVETNADSFDFTVPSDGYTAGKFNYEITGLSGDKTSGEGTVGQKVTVSNVKVVGDRKVTVTITGLTDEYKITVPESPVDGVTITASVNKAAAGTEVTIYAEAKSFSSGDTYAKAVTVDGKTVMLKDKSKTEVTKITVKGNVDLKAEGAVKVVTTPKLKVESMSWNNTQIVLKFNLPVDPSSVAKDDFKLTSNTNNATIDGVSVDGDTVILTLQGIPQKGTDKIAMDEDKVQSKDHADNTNAAYSEATLN